MTTQSQMLEFERPMPLTKMVAMELRPQRAMQQLVVHMAFRVEIVMVMVLRLVAVIVVAAAAVEKKEEEEED